jgi:hypothetical protein
MKAFENRQPETNVTVTITSCGRFDLLQKTIESLFKTADAYLNIKIYDDSANRDQQKQIIDAYSRRFDLYLGEERRGQAFGLDFLYSKVETPWLFHCEDDWEFIDTGYLQESAKVLNGDLSIMIVGLAIKQEYFRLGAAVNLYEIQGARIYNHPKWRIDEKHGYWHGWVGSPNLKRTNDLKKFPKFSSVFDEEEWDREVFGKSGYKSVWLEKCYVRHIGYGRSLFPAGDMIRRCWQSGR